MLKKINYRRLLSIVITMGSIAFFLYFCVNNLNDIPRISFNIITTSVMLLSSLLIVVGIVAVGAVWQVLLKDYGLDVGWKKIHEINAISQFGKYLPGNVGHHFGRTVMNKEIGVPTLVSLNIILIEILWGISVAGTLAIAALFFFVDASFLEYEVMLSPIIISLVAAFCILFPLFGIDIINRFLPILTKKIVGERVNIYRPSFPAAAIISSLFLFCFIIMGLILKLQSVFFFDNHAGDLIELSCLFSLAWLVGYILPGAPGGIGVRETIMILLLSPLLGAGTAVALSITLRITTTVGDAIALGAGLLAKFIPAQ